MTPVCLVPVAGREALLSLGLLGRPLGEHARLAAEAAGLRWCADWDGAVAAGVPVVVHDPLCPLLSPRVLGDLVRRLRGRPIVGVRPVTDTIKTVHDGLVGETLDRAASWSLASPVVIPADLAASLADPDLADLRALVAGLAAVEHVEVPALARRVHDASDVRLLEALAG